MVQLNGVVCGQAGFPYKGLFRILEYPNRKCLNESLLLEKVQSIKSLGYSENTTPAPQSQEGNPAVDNRNRQGDGKSWKIYEMRVQYTEEDDQYD